MKHKFSISLVLFGFSFIFGGTSAFAATDGYLQNDGKLEIQTERIKLTDEEKEKKKEEVSENILDQMDLPLFTDALEQQIANEKEAEEEQLQKMQEALFTAESESGGTVKVIKESLFQDDYESNTKEETTSEEITDSTKNKTIGGVIGGAVIALVGGIYVASRNVWE